MKELSELEKIISDGKVNQGTAMVVFAVEMKSLQEKVDRMTATLDSDDNRYATKSDIVDSNRRIGRLENAIIGFLVVVALAVLTAVLSLVIRQGGK